jgi:hypothetical protein
MSVCVDELIVVHCNGCGAMVRWCDGAMVRWCDGALPCCAVLCCAALTAMDEGDGNMATAVS